MSLVFSKNDVYIGDIITISFDNSLPPWRSIYCAVGPDIYFINQDGSIGNSESIFSADTVIRFTVPKAFYSGFNTRSNAINVRVVDTGYMLQDGHQATRSETTGLIVRARSEDCSPIVDFSITDTNTSTVALTGDSKRLIRYKSNAECALTVTYPNTDSSDLRALQNKLTLQSTMVNNRVVSMQSVTDNDVRRFVGNTAFQNVTENSFAINVTNSMLFRFERTINVTTSLPAIDKANIEMVPYINLTFSPTLTRQSSGENKAFAEFAGSMFVGSFGAVNNYLTVQYRYREITQAAQQWSERQTISPDYITFGASSFKSTQPIELSGTFDYRKSYEVEFYVFDGASDASVKLTELTVLTQIGSGVPVFDWGKNDFNINGDLNINHVNIFDIIYPIGSVYVNVYSTLPEIFESIGTWTAMGELDGLYMWERTA